MPAEPVAATYARIGREHGLSLETEDVAAGFRRGMTSPWHGLRYVGDARPYWREVVRAATGSDDLDYFEALYLHYADPSAWRVAAGAVGCLDAVRAAGVRVGVVSNWDTRLRPVLDGLGLTARLDALVVSAEVGAEKPDPSVFWLACERLGVPPERAVHVGDDAGHDRDGARAAGLTGWLLGEDVATFEDVRARVVQQAQ